MKPNLPGNYFLDALDPPERAAMDRFLHVRKIKAKDVLVNQGEPVVSVQFPLSGLFVNIVQASEGQQIETALIGREGLTGLAPFMAEALCDWQIMCRLPGEVLECRAEDLRRLSLAHPRILTRLLTLTHFYQAQSARLMLCNTYHRTSQRVARWLLTASDYAGSSDLAVTQEEIASGIGVQRTSVVEAFAELKAERVIRHARSHLGIVDRIALLRLSCSCHHRLTRTAKDLNILPGNR